MSGDIGVVPERCPHRGASLSYGYVEDRGIRCAYHGWLFASDGRCVDRPFEMADPTPNCHLPPYQAREQAGLIFISLREEGPPPFPVWDILARDDGGLRIDLQEDVDCNWLQIQENAADVTHTVFLHSRAFANLGLSDPSGFSAPLRQYGFQPFPFGLVKSWVYEDSDGSDLEGWGNLLIFPTMLRIETEMHWRVPLNDTTTRVIILAFEPGGSGISTRVLPKRRGGDGRYTMADFYSQDAMAWETQGKVADRPCETLGASDVGISIYRDMLGDAIDALERSEEVPAQGVGEIVNLRAWMGGYLPMSAPADSTPIERRSRETIFDGQHRTYKVPRGAFT